jgi:hypothetical protein
MAASELLGLKHRPPEIHQQQQRDDAGDHVVEHWSLLRAIARSGYAPEGDEPDHSDEEIKEIKHNRLLAQARIGEHGFTLRGYCLGSH